MSEVIMNVGVSNGDEMPVSYVEAGRVDIAVKGFDVYGLERIIKVTKEGIIIDIVDEEGDLVSTAAYTHNDLLEHMESA